LVAAAQAAPVTLFEVAWPVHRVEVVQRDEARLDVDAGAHLFGGSDQYGDSAVAAGGEQFGAGPVVFGVVGESDLVPRYSAFCEFGSQFGVRRPFVGRRRLGRADIAEDQLQRARSGRGFANVVEVHVVGVGVVDAGDAVGGDVEFLRLRGAPTEKAQI
jgi:hypothetical protein